jgi:hypothetical protein
MKHNNKEYLIKALNIIIYLMRVSFYIGKSFSSHKFIKIIFKVYSQVFSKNNSFLVNKNIDQLIETDSIEQIYSLIVSDNDCFHKNVFYSSSRYFNYSIYIHYLKALNECIENFDGIMNLKGVYDTLESQLLQMLKLVRNENDSCLLLYSNEEKSEFLRQYIKLFTIVFITPPVILNNMASHFNYMKSGKFFLENLSNINLFENLNYFFVKKISECDKENTVENFLILVNNYLLDFKGKL